MKIKLLIILILMHSGEAQNKLAPLAEEIASKDLAITNKDQFEQKLKSLMNQTKTLLPQSFNQSTRERADHLYNRLDAVIEVYADRYPVPELMDETKGLLKELSQKFKLESAIPYVVPIEENREPVNIGTASITEFFDFAQRDKARPMTQTEAYVSRPVLREVITGKIAMEKGVFHTALLSWEHSGIYNVLLARTLTQERKHRDHHVVYHAQERNFILFYDILNELFKRTLEKGYSAFEYLRIPGSATYAKTLAEILQKGFESDTEPEIVKLLLSINLSLFGNARTIGEGSLSAFILNQSINPPRALFELIFDKFGINDAYIKKFEDLFALYKPQEGGNLLQIFIPRSKINDYLYLSQAYGKPLSQKPLLAIAPLEPVTFVDKEGKHHTYDLKTIDAQTYLDIYRNHPQAISYEDMDRIQGRLLISHDFLLNPESGVKIYRYNLMSDQKTTEYKRKLTSLIDEALEDKAKAQARLSPADKELFKTIGSNDSAAVQKILEQEYVDFGAKNERGRTALEVAEKSGNKPILELVEFYSGFASKNEHLMSKALFDALRFSHDVQAEVFINKIPSVNIRFINGQTPLSIVISEKNFPLVKLLLERRADANFTDKSGTTPLTEAITRRAGVPIVKLLLEHGADPNIPTTYGKKPLQLAQWSPNRDLAELLVRYGAKL